MSESINKESSRASFAGVGVLEILVASSVISVAFVSLFFVFVLSQRSVVRASDKIRANFIAEEGLEVARHLRDRSWSGNLAGLTPGTNYYISFNAAASLWSIATVDPGRIDGVFKRTINISSVMRDSADNIVDVGGIVDPDTWKVTATVAWSDESVNAETYLSDVFDN